MNTSALPLLPVCLLACLAACATGPQPEAAHYPTLPVQHGAAAGEPAFEPAGSLRQLPLACRGLELAVANAIDDDCNGSVDDALPGADAPRSTPSDGGLPDDALVLVLSVPQNAPLRLALRAADKSRLDLTPPDCTPDRAFCTHRIPAAQLSRGHSTLLVDSSALEPSASPPSLVVSVQLHGKVTTYVAPVPRATDEQALGELFVP
ncbi:MAG: hypothetical protein JWN48_2600 [Myxococcaceae bacterium]|nr:hypothetical protein [Myxococcaceae bacterium]